MSIRSAAETSETLKLRLNPAIDIMGSLDICGTALPPVQGSADLSQITYRPVAREIWRIDSGCHCSPIKHSYCGKILDMLAPRLRRALAELQTLS